MKKRKKSALKQNVSNAKNYVNQNTEKQIVNLKKAVGITLIALVISIIVMLILAGVSINAIIGDDGIISRTQYSTFLSEMTAVEEAVQMWKTGEVIGQMGEDTKAIPANGLCQVSDLTKTERLAGEVGYYRIWSMTETAPTMSILSSADIFNSNFESELMYYPAGVQDLFYLNNEVLGIESNKTYVMDIATGMIYSLKGITLKGVSCYSSNMATAVMIGSSNAPIFAESEVSGTGNDDKLAGNTEHEYGFEIIASPKSDNIFKLYNNGDLYGKGIKGAQLNTSPEEMKKVNANIWQEWDIPSNIGTVKQTIVGNQSNSLCFIDGNDDLWCYGENVNNKFGLTQEQQVEYTGREATKINLNGKKVSRAFLGNSCTFIITKDNELLAAGRNINGELGLGHKNSTITFEKVNINNVDKISNIYMQSSESAAKYNIIRYSDNTFYFAGANRWGQLAISNNTRNESENFIQIWNGELGGDIDQDIDDIIVRSGLILLMNNSVYIAGYGGYYSENLLNESVHNFKKMPIENVKKIYEVASAIFFEVENDEGNIEIWANPGGSNYAGSNYNTFNYPVKLVLPQKLEKEKIKEIYPAYGCCYILSKTGELYGTGDYSKLGLDIATGYTEEIVPLNQNGIETLYSDISVTDKSNCVFILNKNSKYYTTGSSIIMFGEKILQKNWSLIAKNVKNYQAGNNCYVDRDGFLWVNGDSRCCGLGTMSETYNYINNYIKNTDSNISGHVVKSWQDSDALTYVLLDDNSLWATGVSMLNGVDTFPGWEDEENKINFVKIIEDVAFYDMNQKNTNPNRIAIKKDGTLYGWGVNYGNSCGGSGVSLKLPTKFELTNEINGVDNILKLSAPTWQRSFILTKTGEFYLSGTWANPSYDGGHEATAYFSKYTYNLSDDIKIIDAVKMNDENGLLVSSTGLLYGWGNANYLGINKPTNERREMQEIPNIDKIVQIVAGNGWYIAIDKEGKVYGTGSNTYGILGRWIGIDRKQPNSRYKTAFEWVECPELEI